MSETTVADGVCRLAVPDGRWLATGFDGGYASADAAYNVSVPSGFDRTDLASYADDRLRRAGFDGDGPRLLTGVEMEHARGARYGTVAAVVTAGISNPAALPLERTDAGTSVGDGPDRYRPGTINVLLCTTRELADGTLATLLGTVVEAKTATLQQAVGFSGTTTDAVAVGCDPAGDAAAFAGSGTAVGNAARVCVRDALCESLESRYGKTDRPDTVGDADHGVRTDGRAQTFRP
jgi:adenosylcobinamide hydrolase